MTEAFDEPLQKPVPATKRFGPAALNDAVRLLSQQLGAGWDVEQETDCDGEVSLIVLAADDRWEAAAFIIFERGGHPRLAKIQCDTWEWERGCRDLEQAVDALVAASREAEAPARGRRSVEEVG
ncbi:MAG TPA: hypothetical protein VGM32_05135 [Rhodopila sp.]|jgi:hypothetical protein